VTRADSRLGAESPVRLCSAAPVALSSAPLRRGGHASASGTRGSDRAEDAGPPAPSPQDVLPSSFQVLRT
jgi:hypothetical protein